MSAEPAFFSGGKAADGVHQERVGFIFQEIGVRSGVEDAADELGAILAAKGDDPQRNLAFTQSGDDLDPMNILEIQAKKEYVGAGIRDGLKGGRAAASLADDLKPFFGVEPVSGDVADQCMGSRRGGSGEAAWWASLEDCENGEAIYGREP